jgi:hypothetical protein
VYILEKCKTVKQALEVLQRLPLRRRRLYDADKAAIWRLWNELRKIAIIRLSRHGFVLPQISLYKGNEQYAYSGPDEIQFGERYPDID